MQDQILLKWQSGCPLLFVALYIWLTIVTIVTIYSYFIITPLGKATQVRMWPRWLTRHNRRKWINRRWKKAKAGSIVWVGSLVGVYPTKSGWWLGTWVLFSHILGIIIPTDFDIFQRGWNHQPDWIWLLGDSGQVNFSSGDHCQSYWMFFFVVL